MNFEQAQPDQESTLVYSLMYPASSNSSINVWPMMEDMASLVVSQTVSPMARSKNRSPMNSAVITSTSSSRLSSFWIQLRDLRVGISMSKHTVKVGGELNCKVQGQCFHEKGDSLIQAFTIALVVMGLKILTRTRTHQIGVQAALASNQCMGDDKCNCECYHGIKTSLMTWTRGSVTVCSYTLVTWHIKPMQHPGSAGIDVRTPNTPTPWEIPMYVWSNVGWRSFPYKNYFDPWTMPNTFHLGPYALGKRPENIGQTTWKAPPSTNLIVVELIMFDVKLHFIEPHTKEIEVSVVELHNIIKEWLTFSPNNSTDSHDIKGILTASVVPLDSIPNLLWGYSQVLAFPRSSAMMIEL
ncbi:hypothetical protein DFJ58DRAFT_845908 [Suillus subalutaceus]|uniref:uncharacterized protein n=1 Tax=Suillus subalutaceus TaxID=48586 RepID=UPI001B87CBEF|nr:uncharacterized protein DFJ58DRAFT_845908 [Suillus subalutaceus]KAG1838866.1 hypothetical protein DFJ58DRAFT_845908 [Suillus subalutaceus]